MPHQVAQSLKSSKATAMGESVDDNEKAIAVPLMRKSCKFCRARKIKCSGEPDGCESCMTRRQECVYEPAAPMGRPRKYAKDESFTISGLPNAGELVTKKTSVSASKLGFASGSTVAESPAAGTSIGWQIQPAAIPSKPISVEDVERGVSELRLRPGLNETWAHERIGVLVRAHFNLVCPNAKPLVLPKYRSPRSTRFLYEIALCTRITPSRDEAENLMDNAARNRVSDNLDVDMMSWFTWGTPSKCDPRHQVPVFLRWLQSDRITPFPDIQISKIEDPSKLLSQDKILSLVTKWFRWHMAPLYVNDADLLRQMDTGEIDRALLCAIIGFVLDLAPKQTKPGDSPLPPNPSPDVPNSLSTKFWEYTQHLVFNRASTGALRLSTLQTLCVWSIRESAFQQPRRAWALNSCMRALAREFLKREMARKAIDQNWGLRDEMQFETLLNVCWLNATWGAWAFLSLGMPKPTFFEVLSGLPLPPPNHAKSASYQYRSKFPHLSLDEISLQETIQRFGDRARCSSLILTLETKASSTFRSSNIDPTTFDLQLANWLVEGARVLSRDYSKRGEEDLKTSPFLSAVNAILAMHRVHPFNVSRQSLSPAKYSVCFRAMDFLFRSATPALLQYLNRIGVLTIKDRSQLTGIVRLLADAVPACIAIMEDFILDAKSVKDILPLVETEKERIGANIRQMEMCVVAGLDIDPIETSLEKIRMINSTIEFLSPSSQESSPESDFSAYPHTIYDSTSTLNSLDIPVTLTSVKVEKDISSPITNLPLGQVPSLENFFKYEDADVTTNVGYSQGHVVVPPSQALPFEPIPPFPPNLLRNPTTVDVSQSSGQGYQTWSQNSDLSVLFNQFNQTSPSDIPLKPLFQLEWNDVSIPLTTTETQEFEQEHVESGQLGLDMHTSDILDGLQALMPDFSPSHTTFPGGKNHGSGFSSHLQNQF